MYFELNDSMNIRHFILFQVSFILFENIHLVFEFNPETQLSDQRKQTLMIN